jgi:hypothetical protein
MKNAAAKRISDRGAKPVASSILATLLVLISYAVWSSTTDYSRGSALLFSDVSLDIILVTCLAITGAAVVWSILIIIKEFLKGLNSDASQDPLMTVTEKPPHH